MSGKTESSATEAFLQGLLAGAIVARLNKNLILGTLVGLAAGAMYHQQVPNATSCNKYKRRGNR